MISPALLRIAGPLIAAALLIAALWALWSRGEHYRTQRNIAIEQRDLAQRELTLARKDAALKETAAVERQADGAAVAQAEKDLRDAIHAVPDTQPDAVRVALGCQRLRASGRLDADIPEQCRSSR